MQIIIPSSEQCAQIIQKIRELLLYVGAKRTDRPDKYIKSATYAKFEKAIAGLLMDISNLKRYVENENLWYEDFQLPQNKVAKEDLIDHYYRDKPTSFFIKVFSLFEDALSRILEALGCAPDVNNFEEKLKKLKTENIISREDRQFCRFCMHIRNTIHSNSFFRAEDQTFDAILGEGPFVFQKGKDVDFLSTGRLIKWSQELINIFEKISEFSSVIDGLKDNAMREDL